ncbi:4-phosphoerythronate dehydrogenase [Pseudoalteromonas denitrificans]|uniref:Erythronate-4-phosphate dehydrogenase n=1 Tax=Pseudoalteromonas denitrificans DSM 6059 TaxID=1123010 RepID=A0A1I1TVM8_9GAMM|nr:4-phosphoerythronate dehydrogenase [Pseudoalteromonas denitrificans]SFD62564.1 4-phosphoerythronate dehydrogenase [Pseudoalteromonas denitrificans DSM 6059]
MRILADQNMPLVDEYFSGFGEITRFDGRSLNAEQLIDVDVLLTRSITQVNDVLLSKANKLKFVGTATIGTDHIDQTYLTKNDIFFTNAPGCNSVAVAEYVISSLYALAQEDDFLVQDKVVGIIGVGNIGSILNTKLTALGITTLLCDPLNQSNNQEYLTFDQVVHQADVISLHVPLIKDGQYKTKHMFNEVVLQALKDNVILINASRGDVIDNQALLKQMQTGKALSLVLDVWENEPNILVELMDYVRFASVHIAGHTLEGKARGTQMLYQALCLENNQEPKYQLSDFLPQPVIANIKLNNNFSNQDIRALVHSIYDVRSDHGLISNQLMIKGFDFLRKNYPARREFSAVSISSSNKLQTKQLAQLGFEIYNEEK